MILEKKRILDNLKECQPIFAKSGINLLGLFGSYASSEGQVFNL